jgi:hypothetical protein
MTRATDPTPQDRFTLAVWRRLRDTAAPIPASELEAIATGAGLDPDALARRLRGGAERNEAGDLLGLGGLTVADHPHALWFGDRRLSTWCAWDPFFLAPALGGSARLETTDPVTGAPFAVTFIDGEPQPPEDPQPVLSMVDRTALRTLDGDDSEDGNPGDGPAVGESFEDVWSSF